MRYFLLFFLILTLPLGILSQKDFRLLPEKGSYLLTEFSDPNQRDFVYKELASGSYIDFQQTHEVTLLEKGKPQLPSYSVSFVLPAKGRSSYRIVYSEVEVIENVQVLPSKGNLKRNINPESVSYEFGEVYNTDAFFPEEPVRLEKPFNLRSIRGQVLLVFPYQYNPVTKTLKHYKNIRIEILTDSNQPGENELDTPPRGNDAKYYSRFFINPLKTSKYNAIEEDGDMLVLAPASYLDSLQPFFDWKNSKGISCKVITVEESGETTASVKKRVEDEYLLNPDLKYLLLVGDHQQIPAYSYGTTGNNEELFSDSYYGQITGSDYYPELFVGRFSGTVAQVSVMVNRTLEYETNPAAGDWMTRALGLGSGEGAGYGDEGQADWQHLRAIRDQLLDYGYTEVYEFYEGSRGQDDAPGDPTPTIIRPVVSSGVGLFNYTGHGDINTCVTGSFSSTQINLATNNGMYPFVISVACNNGTFTYGNCISETWLRATENNTPSGAIAACGSSILMSWAPPMQTQDELADLILRNDSVNIKNTLGGLFYNAQMSMLEHYPGQGEEVMQTWVFFGDPSVDYRNKVTQDLAVAYDNCIQDLPVQSVSFTSPENDVLITLSQDNTILAKGRTSNGGLTLTLGTYDPDREVEFVCSKPNFKPLFGALQFVSCGSGSPKIYPVPASAQLTLDFGKEIQSLQYKMYDVSGKIVAEYSNPDFASDKKIVDTGMLAHGIYTILIHDGSEERAYKLLILNQ